MAASAVHRAGLTQRVIAEIDHLVVGCGGFARELIGFTSGSSTRKGESRERLSAADQRVDDLLRHRLTTLVPGSGGYSEEAGRFGTTSGELQVRWLIDPLDGTRAALMGGAFAVSVCALVVEHEQPTAAVGWIYVPTLGSLYRAVLHGEFREALLNGTPLDPPGELAPEEWPHRYLAIGSDSFRNPLPQGMPWKVTAPGATAVHLTQVVHPDSDVIGVLLTRYRPYDAAAGLVLTAALGLGLYRIDPQGRPGSEEQELLEFLRDGDREPDRPGPRMLVAHEAVAACLRQLGTRAG